MTSDTAAAPFAGQPQLSTAEIASARASWIASGRSAEQFDAAVAADGQPSPAVPSEADATAVEFGLAASADASIYNPVFGRSFASSLSPDSLGNVHRETTELAASLRLSSELGTALIEHLAEIGPAVAAMGEPERAAWLAEQRRIGLRLAGSELALDEMLRQAQATLAATKLPLAINLSQSAQLHSAWLVVTLANHAKIVAAWKAKVST